MIFLGGLSRSGTTLLQGMICNSPQTMGMSAECSYFRALMEAYKQTKHPGFWNHAQDYFDDWQNFYFFHDFILDEYFWRACSDPKPPALPPIAVQEEPRLLKVRPKLYDFPIAVQKEPRLLKVWPELYDFYSDAEYVITIRDPRDILASQLRRNPKTDINQWLNEQLNNLAYAMKGPQENVWARYEELVTDPQKTLNDLGYALGIEIPVKEWEVKRKDDSCSPLDGKLPEPSSIGRWKDVLQPSVAKQLKENTQQWFIDTTNHDWFWEES